jgi:hypothetical protein
MPAVRPSPVSVIVGGIVALAIIYAISHDESMCKDTFKPKSFIGSEEECSPGAKMEVTPGGDVICHCPVPKP